MKKIKLGWLTVVLGVSLGTVSLFSSIVIPANTIVAQAEEVTTAEVSSIDEFETALKNSSITLINVNKTISFKRNITNIPNRDLTINGNQDKGIVINSNDNSIYGKQNTKGKNTLKIVNSNIIGNDVNGRFFTGGAGNGPSSYGWDVYAENITYHGARFVHLSEGKLTFAGTNTVKTRAENAWVHDLEFLPDTVYNGVAANKDHGQFSAFYFNGALIKGKATGEVKIGDGAKLNIEIGPQSNVNYYYPVFYDKVQKVDVGNNVQFSVDAAGVAFQFIPRADYAIKSPQLNIGENSNVTFNGRGGGDYATMKLQYYGSEVNVGNDSSLVVTGNSKKAVIESEYKGATFNLQNVKNFEVANKKEKAKLFYATDTTIKGSSNYLISVWNQTGGDYNEAAVNTVFGSDISTNFGKICNSKTLSSTGLDESWKLENYGKISFFGWGSGSGTGGGFS